MKYWTLFLIFAIVTPSSISSVYAAGPSTYSENLVTSKDQRIFVNVYGLRNTTGEVLALVKAGDAVEKSSMVNAADLDLRDNITDGAGQLRFLLKNSSLATGQEFDVCILATQMINLFCQKGYRSTSPVDYVSIILIGQHNGNLLP
jgi:hypothetical protein